MINLYLLLPTLLGNLTSWGIYLLIKRKGRAQAQCLSGPAGYS
jgi:hypothetical protein